MPWCKKKCPYCDFNSHEFKDVFPEEKYCEALLKDFFDVLPSIKKRRIERIKRLRGVVKIMWWYQSEIKVQKIYSLKYDIDS